MGMTRCESAEQARAAYSARARALMDEYAAAWAHRPNWAAARHFEVSLRTIGRWRQLLELPDRRQGHGPPRPRGAR